MGSVITSSGVGIGVDEAGSGDAVPIVFLHGVGSDKSVWAPQLAHFGASRRAVAFDYPGYGESDPGAAGTTATISRPRCWRRWTRSASTGPISAACRLAEWWRSRCTRAAPDRCVSLIIADSFAVHPDGHAIHERSIAAATDMRALAEGRADALLAQPADPAVRKEVIETMAKSTPPPFASAPKPCGSPTSATAPPRSACRRWCCAATEDRMTPPALSRELAHADPGRPATSWSRAPVICPISSGRTNSTRWLEAFIRGVDSRSA